jgi:hypothetical protein
VIFLSILATLMSVAAPARSQTLMTGDIVQFIKTIKDAMPDMGTNKFFIPTNAHLNFFDTLFIDLKKKDLATIESRAAQYGYQFIKFVNTASKDTLYILKESTPVMRGWGTYIFDPSSMNDLTIEAPHPLWDTNSWELAIRAYIKTNARWFILAGTHRYSNSDSSSDMAHVTQSVFHICHKRAGTSRAIQIHGFSKTGGNTGYPDLVISNGTLNPPSILYTVQTKYTAKGFTAGVFSTSTYSALNNLGATTNKQGQYSNNNGRLFVHIEHDYPLRNTPAKLTLCVEAIDEVFGLPTGVDDEPLKGPSDFQLYQNYPNPFNPATTIKFYLPTDGWTTVSVTDLSGRTVGRLLNDHLHQGIHTVQFSGERLSSGIYFCTITTASFMRTMKMVLIQ